MPENLPEWLQWLLKIFSLFSKQHKEKSQRVVEYIDQCLLHMHTIMEQDGKKSSEIEYAHTWLKQAYLDLFNTIGNLASPKECDIIRQSIVSARVLYHAIRYGKVEDESTQKDYEERLIRYTKQVYDQVEFRPNSNELFLRELAKDGKSIQESDRTRILNHIKEVCMEDIARIDSLKEVIKTRRVYVVS